MAVVLSVGRELPAAVRWKDNHFPSCIRQLCLLVLCFSLTAPIHAQLPYTREIPLPDRSGTFDTLEPGKRTETAFIQCTVQDSKGNPVLGATVQIHQPASIITAGLETSIAGQVRAELPVGFYEIRATYRQLSVSQWVSVDRFGAKVVLHLPSSNVAGQDATRGSIPISQLMIPEKAKTEFEKAREALRKNAIANAQAHLQQALTIYPAFAEAYMWLGITNIWRYQFDLACAQLERAIENDPSLAMAYFALASAHNNMGRFQEARQAVDRGLLLNPNAWQGYYEGARADAAKGEFDSALRQLSKAEQLAPPENVHLVLFNRADALAYTGHGEEAVSILKSYISKNPSGPYTARARELLAQLSRAPSR